MPFDHENKREFERFSVSLNAEVTSTDDDAKSYSETIVLLDISGGGMRFVTAYPERYSVGDRVGIVIHLPGEKVLHGRMEGVGRIAWTGEFDEGETSIGLCMDDLLAFDQFVDESE